MIQNPSSWEAVWEASLVVQNREASLVVQYLEVCQVALEASPGRMPQLEMVVQKAWY
jgi:hypothetical protein